MISAARLSRGVASAFAAVAGQCVGPRSRSRSSGSGCRVTASVARGPRVSLPGFGVVQNRLFDGPVSKATLNSHSRPGPVETGRGQRAPHRIRPSLESDVPARARARLSLRLPPVRERADPALFTSSIEALATAQPDATTYAVSRLAGATGYRTNPHVQIGRVAGDRIVFTRGNTGFFVYAVVPPELGDRGTGGRGGASAGIAGRGRVAGSRGSDLLRGPSASAVTAAGHGSVPRTSRGPAPGEPAALDG